MISEGLLAEDRFPSESRDEWQEGIHFSYERFSDHLIARYLLDKYLDPENPSCSFLSDQRLGVFFKDELDCWQNKGLIEAFSVQVPERLKRELFEIAPACAGYQPVQEAFVESLIWRTPDAFSDATLEYINNYVRLNELVHNRFLNVLLTIASNPKHPYNAAFLHRNLMNFRLADRDEWWSIFLHYQWGEHGAVDHLVDWCWSSENRDQIDDESIKLCGIALAWFLTTSNRFLRDRATKALVSLLTNRIHVLRQILNEFKDVNDPYVMERLFATAYGCAMRAQGDNAIAELAKDIYKSIFINGMPPAHILLRDYARGVIEIALTQGINLDIEVEKIRPPYKSAWPSEIPKEMDLKRYGEWDRDMPYEERARVHLYDSVMGKGLSDFSHYVIGTDGGFEWSSDRLGEPRNPTKKEIYEDFIRSLTDEQRTSWNAYYALLQRKSFTLYDTIIDITWAKDADDEGENELLTFSAYRMLQDHIDILINEVTFRRSLDEHKVKLFDEHIISFLNEPSHHTDENLFDLSIVQRWILQKVLDLGWTVERFGRFDTFISSNRGREANKPERIGKKYQWIAYHEILARISDNFEFRDKWSDGAEKYEGPWQMHLRDIDPSCLLRSTASGNWWDNPARAWWFLASYDAWDSKQDDVSWLKSESDLPDIGPLIEVTDPEDGSKWLVLDAYYKWESPTPPEEERFENPKREIWYMLKSYIVKKPDADELFEWAKQQNFENRWMPESQDIHRVFFGEFYWSQAFSYYSYNDDWTRGNHNEMPKEVLVSSVEYSQESGDYDCSIDEGIGIILPAKWIVDGMGLKWNGIEGKLFDKENNLVAMDPSANEPGPSALLIKKDIFISYLNKNGYDILWTILGEKNILGTSASFDNWKGRLEINGAYRIYQDELKGEIKTEYRSPEKS